MQIPIQHTAGSLREAQKFQTPGWRRGLRGLRHVRLTIYLLVGLWVAGGMLLRGLRAGNSHDLGSGLGLLLLVLMVPAILYWSAQRKVNQSLSAQVPATLEFTAAGLLRQESTGQTSFEPWSAFTSFRQGRHSLLIARQGKSAPLIIPTGLLDEASRGSLRSMLLSNLLERS